MELWKKTANILLNGQAYLYATLCKLELETKLNTEVTQKMFDEWQEAWLEETRKELSDEI